MGVLIDDLVSSEEAQDVVVILEALDNTEHLLVVDGAIGGPWLAAIQITTRQRVADIKNHVDAGGVEDRSTLIVVERGFQVVDTDGVDL
jgi:hypothetical protein